MSVLRHSQRRVLLITLVFQTKYFFHTRIIIISTVATNIYSWLKEKKPISLIVFPGWCHYIITRHSITHLYSDKNPNRIRKPFLSSKSCRAPVAVALKHWQLLCGRAMPCLQQGTSSAHIPLKPPELAPQLLWEAKETTLVLNIGPLFLVTDINSPTSTKPQMSGHLAPYNVWLLTQTLQTFKEWLSRLHSLVWMRQSLVCLGLNSGCFIS